MMNGTLSPLMPIFERESLKLLSKVMAEGVTLPTEAEQRVLQHITEAIVESFREGSKFQLQSVMEIVYEYGQQSNEEHQPIHSEAGSG